MIEIFGVKELDEFFNSLSKSDQAKVVMDSYRLGSKPIVETARALLKSRLKGRNNNGVLLKSLGFVPLKYKQKSNFVSAKIGARRFGPYSGFHGHLFDAGTATRSTRRGWGRGRVKATNFFTEAVNTKGDAALNEITEGMILALNKNIEKQIKKINNTEST